VNRSVDHFFATGHAAFHGIAERGWRFPVTQSQFMLGIVRGNEHLAVSGAENP
jgi:hypothetical protein